jgi:hypothetical protein
MEAVLPAIASGMIEYTSLKLAPYSQGEGLNGSQGWR